MKKVTGRTRRIQSYMMLSLAIAAWLAMPVYADGNGRVVTRDIIVQATRAEEEAKYESQQTSIITSKEIEKKQAKSVEDVIFQETGVSRTVDAMGRVGVSIRGAEPRHTLILVDGQRVMGDLAKYYGASDEVTRLGTENVDHIEVIQGAASAKYGADAIGGVINVVTKKAKKKPTIQINAEGRRVRGEGDIFPYQNVFFRADSGEMGKLRLGLYGSKRDILHEDDPARLCRPRLPTSRRIPSAFTERLPIQVLRGRINSMTKTLSIFVPTDTMKTSTVT